VCRLHGGAAFQVREAAAERVVEASIVAEADRYTTPLPTTAREALQAELDRTNGAIAYLARTVERFPEPPPEWLAVLNVERQHLARLADRMVGHQSRVEDVEADVRARMVEQLEAALTGILIDLGHDPDDTVTRAVVAHHLRRASGTAPTAPTPARQPQPLTAVPPPPPAAF
jgi:hypothetical protein